MKEKTAQFKNPRGLLRSGQLLSALLESVTDALVVVDDQKRVALLNPAAERLFSVSSQSALGRPLMAFFPKAAQASLTRSFDTADLANRVPAERPLCRLSTKGQRGEALSLEASVTPIGLKAGAWLLVLREIKSEHEADLEQVAAIVEHTDDAVYSRTPAGRVTSWNAAAERMFGYSAREMIGQSSLILEPKSRAGEFDGLVKRVRSGGMVRQFATERCRKDGQLIHVSLTVSPVRDKDRRLVGISTIARDITARKQLEREILAISERERQRLARELHDGLGQHLSGAAYLADSLREQLTQRGLPEVTAAERLTKLTEEAIQLTRDLARGLLPVPAEPTGLMTALRDLAARICGVFRVECRFVCRRPVTVPDETTATHLYRIAQEAVHNALRHGKATQVEFALSIRHRCLILAVMDNGVGISQTSPRRGGMGLNVMRYRAGLVHGSLLVQPRAKGGTEVICSIDLHNGQPVAFSRTAKPLQETTE